MTFVNLQKPPLKSHVTLSSTSQKCRTMMSFVSSERGTITRHNTTYPSQRGFAELRSQRFPKKYGCKEGLSSTGSITAGVASSSSTTLIPFGHMERPRRRRLPTPNKPVIGYTQKTWKLSSGEAMHAESGYWRPRPDGTIEVVIAQSTGLVEVQVKEIRRCFQLVDGNLCYEVQMATHTITLQPHLKAELKKL